MLNAQIYLAPDIILQNCDFSIPFSVAWLPLPAGQYHMLKPVKYTNTHTHIHLFLWIVGTFHRRNVFYTEQTVFSIALQLNLPLTGNHVHFFFLKKTTTFCMIYKPFENMGTWGNVLISHLLLVISMSYPIYKCISSYVTKTYAHTCIHTNAVCTYAVYLFINTLTTNTDPVALQIVVI